MFDARQLLDQIMGAAQSGGQSKGRPGGSADLLKGALAGGALGMLAGNKRARKFATKSAGTALKLGGLAAVAAIGYTAWQRHRGATGPALDAPPSGSPFALPHAPAQADDLARGMLVAMIQGAKADGHIDADEHARIFQQIDTMGLDADAKAFVMDELRAPLDVARIAAYASTPELATELYAATLLVMDPDTPEERHFLIRLQGALGLDPALAGQIEAAVAAEVQG